ncbi:hypothetical protein Q7P35_010605 [Cladosporium inversicolor]
MYVVVRSPAFEAVDSKVKYHILASPSGDDINRNHLSELAPIEEYQKRAVMYPARTSGTDSSIAALNPNGDCDYFVEHIILLVSCVYAASQDSKAFYIASVFVVLIGSYNWMLSILRPPPSVAAWIALSDTASSTASFSLDGAFDYLVEHMMLLVSCVYAASQGSGAFFFTSLFTVLISTYIWIQAVLQFSPSVPPRRMTSGFLNCEEPFRIRRGLEPDALRSSSDTGLEVSYHGIGSAQQQDYGIETHRLDVVDGIALEADVCDNVPRPPLLEIDPDIFTADIQCADVCVNTCDTVPHLPLLEIDPDIFTEEVRYVDTGVCDTVPHLPLLEIDPDIFTAALDMKDVRFVMSQAGVSMELAVAALKENDNDLVDSIMWAAGEFEGSHRAQTPVNDGQRGRFEHCFVFLPSRQEQSPQVMTDEATASEESHVTDTKTKSRSKERRAKRQRERRAKERLKKESLVRPT